MPAFFLAIPAWKLGVIAAGTMAAFFLASPPGQQATKEAAAATVEALKKLRPVPDPKKKNKPDQRVDPITPIEPCPKDKEKKEKCPVCGIYPNPTPGVIPAYVVESRSPHDSETIPPLKGYKRTKKRPYGATVWERPDGTFIHRDTFHKGKGSELETYDRRGNHTGTICPHCGAPRGGPIPGRDLSRY